MFTTKPRPVPSKAALRVLYQLAYISSGTAVGVAALCAEERRRRTRLVQKVAENAKRLRQSPRHVHSLAVALEETEYDFGAYQDVQQKETTPTYRRTRQPAPRARYSPSVVEEDFAKLARLTDTVVTDRVVRDAALGPTAPAHATRESLRIDQQSRKNLLYRYNDQTLDRGLGHKSVDAFERSKEKIGHEASEQLTSGQFQRHDNKVYQASSPMVNMSQSNASIASLETALTDMRQIFFGDSLHRPEDFTAGTGQESLRWSSIQELLDGRDLLISQHGSRLSFAFYCMILIDLLHSPALCADRPATATFFGIVLDSLSKWLNTKEQEHYTADASALCRAMLGDSSATDFLLALDDFCRTQAQSGDQIGAIDLLMAIYTLDIPHKHAIMTRIDSMFREASSAREFPLCRSILLRKASIAPLDNHFGVQLDTLLKMTDANGRGRRKVCMEIIDGFESGRWPMALLYNLSVEAKAILASVCTKDGHDSRLFARLTEQLPQDFVGLSTMSSPFSEQLIDLWEETRNLASVRSTYGAATRADTAAVYDAAASQTMIRILTQANEFEAAATLLAVALRQAPLDAPVFSLAVVLHAKRNDWQQFSLLIQAAAEAKVYTFDMQSTRNMTMALNIYCRHHTPAECWSLATTMIETLGIAHIQVTTTTLLEAFVRQRAYDMIPRWLRYMSTQGRDYHMTDEIVVRLLQRFYFDQRPPHASFIRMCRRLFVDVPGLDANRLTWLIEHAILYDLRHCDAKDKHRLQRKAFRHLEIMSRSGLGGLFKSLAVDDASNERPSSATSTVGAGNELDTLPFVPDQVSLPSVAEQEMLVAFSNQEWQRVHRIYEETSSQSGLPRSASALEMGVEACARLHGLQAADSIIHRAREAGFDVTCAMDTILTHSIKTGQYNSSEVRPKVLDHYRNKTQNGLAVSHHVGVTAAKFLIDCSQQMEAVRVLEAAYEFQPDRAKVPNMAFMSVFLQAYTEMQSWSGVTWVLKTVLDSDVRIDHRFLEKVKKLCDTFSRGAKRSRNAHTASTMHAVAKLEEWRRRLAAKRLHQRQATKNAGEELVQAIIDFRNANKTPAIDIVTRRGEKQEYAGQAIANTDADWIDVTEASVSTTSPSLHNEQTLSSTSDDSASLIRDVKAYRASNKRTRLITSGGKVATFRFQAIGGGGRRVAQQEYAAREGRNRKSSGASVDDRSDSGVELTR